MSTLRASEALAILNRAHDFEWTVQGLGMLRLYLDAKRDWRLNVWHDSLANVGVSRMHDHPWAFESVTLCGEIANIRFTEIPEDQAGPGDLRMNHSRLHCSNVGELDGPTTIRHLRAGRTEYYQAGGRYRQEAAEIHLSHAVNGTVTLLRRHRLGDNEHASVYWPIGHEFGDARKAPPTADEITLVAAAAAERLRRAV
jgi:hypothetical protein